MGTGIVSIALATSGFPELSRVLLGLAALTWSALVCVAATRLGFDRRRFLFEAHSPAGLTGVAGTAVLGSRLGELGWTGASIALLAIALAAWPVLLILLLPRLPKRGSGQMFMLTVAAESLASLSATLAARHAVLWLAYLAIALAALGLLAYPLALARFRLSDLLQGRGDQWVAGGSLAISSLALADLASAATRLGPLAGAATVLSDLALAVWVVAAVWIVPLLAGELARPRLRYRSHRWATVFPLGMYSASAFSVGNVAGVRGLESFARVWIWLAVAVWAVVAGAMLVHGLRSLRRRDLHTMWRREVSRTPAIRLGPPPRPR